MYKRYVTDNGIRVITEKISHFRSVSIGLWFKIGTVIEDEDNNGLSHFIEHMMFKGTEARNAKQIAEAMDAVGGQLNAFTAKECTCYYAKVLDEHIDLALNVLSDMTLNSIFDPIEMNKEKGVILEEILMYEDSPEDMVYDLLASSHFGAHPLGMPILGNQRNLEGFQKEEITSFMERYYTSDNLVISVAGNFDEVQLVNLINKYFGKLNRSNDNTKRLKEPMPIKKIRFREKDIEQVHLCIGSPGVKLGQEETYSLMVFNNIFGGGMSSRLFQRIREEKGLAYSIFSFPSNYTCGGLYTIYSSMKVAQVVDVLTLIMSEIREIQNKGVTKEEFRMAKEQLKGNYILGLESTSSRMTAIGKSELLLNKVITPSQVLNKIDSVTLDDIHRIIDIIFNIRYTTLAMVGREDLTSQLASILV